MFVRKDHTVCIRPFKISCLAMEMESLFRQRLESKVMSHTSWRIVQQTAMAKWVFQGCLESCEIRGISIDKYKGNSTRLEIILKASIELRDGQTGKLIQGHRNMVFVRQYPVDSLGINFYQNAMDEIAEDFADSAMALIVSGN